MKQSKITCLFKVRRLGKKHFHIRPALASRGQRRHIIQIVKIRGNPCQKLSHGKVNRHLPVVCNSFQKPGCLSSQFFRCFLNTPVLCSLLRCLFDVPALCPLLRSCFCSFLCSFLCPLLRSFFCFFLCPLCFPLLAAVFQGIIQGSPLLPAADKGNFLLRKASKQRLHRSKQRNILSGIVQHSQKLQQLLYLRGCKISGFRRDIHRNPLCLQRLFKGFIPSAVGAQKNHNVRIL